ncbi:MAG: DUF2550 family protein [Actinomycetaceae bacterium]|nr:DUF2550 family protein [Actinomycetaceae bacterium]
MGEIISMVLLALMLLLGLALLYFGWRLRFLGRSDGSFECAFRKPGQARWMAGIGIYAEGRLDWFRVISLSLGPYHSWPQGAFEVVDSRPRPGVRGLMEVECSTEDGTFYLAMRAADHIGFVAWLEAAPPHSQTFF